MYKKIIAPIQIIKKLQLRDIFYIKSLFNEKDIPLRDFNIHDVLSYKDVITIGYERYHWIKSFSSQHSELTNDLIQSTLLKGHTIRVNELQNHINEIDQLKKELHDALSLNFNINLYHSSNRSKGTSLHQDQLGSFIVQLQGKKEWTVLKDTDNGGFSEYKITLNKGDFLYIPAKMVHKTYRCKDEFSTHITLSTGNPEMDQNY